MVFPRHKFKDREICEPVVGMKLGRGLRQLSGDSWEGPACLTVMGSGRRTEGHWSGNQCGQNLCNSREKKNGSSLSFLYSQFKPMKGHFNALCFVRKPYLIQNDSQSKSHVSSGAQSTTVQMGEFRNRMRFANPKHRVRHLELGIQWLQNSYVTKLHNLSRKCP